MSADVDKMYMKRAIELAKRGEGFVSPNPMVGAVIVKDSEIISEGWHEAYGKYHAERNAILKCKRDMTGATIYVTLEPCCHYGKTPPCTEIIIQSGIKRVVIGSIDENPLVKAKGVEILREHGIEVETGVLEKECLKLNEVFFYHMKTKLPFVALKYAMTADGKIAAYTGASKWITGESSRSFVHELRKKYMAIMVGIGTVLNDNPMLNCRIENGKNPIRIICDSTLKIPLDCNICKTADTIKTYAAACEGFDAEKARALEAKGIEIIECGEYGKGVDLFKLMKILGERNIDGILLEGGGALNYSALKSGIVNKVYSFIAPKIFGGAAAKSPVEGEGVSLPEEAFMLEKTDIRIFGDDILVEYNLKKSL